MIIGRYVVSLLNVNLNKLKILLCGIILIVLAEISINSTKIQKCKLTKIVKLV